MSKPHISKFILASGFLGAMISLSFATSAQEQPVFADGFESGLENWRKTEERIEQVSQGCFEGTSCVKISRNDRRGYTHISRSFRVNAPGTLKFQARFRAENMVVGSEDFHTGKFIGVVIDGGREISWPNDDIRTSIDGWELRSFEVVDLDPSLKVDLRIGLQNAKGSLFVDDVRAMFIPD